jgi:hypothetical protein
MSDLAALLTAKLDHSNPSHFVDSGEPSLAVVKTITGRAYSRAEVAATGILRGKPSAAKPVVDHQAVIAEKSAATQEAIQQLAAAKAVLRVKNEALSVVHGEWMRAFPPPSSDEIYRAHLAALAKHAPAAPVEVKPASKLDAIMQAAPRRGRDITGNTRRVRSIR